MTTKTNKNPLPAPGPRRLSLAIGLVLLSPAFAQEVQTDQSDDQAQAQLQEQPQEQQQDQPQAQAEDAQEGQVDEFTLEEATPPATDPERIQALTQVRNTVEFGVGYVSDDAFRFGRYRGLEEEGAFALFSIDYLRRGPYDGNSTDYLRVTGNRLGLRSREAGVEFGRQGDFRLRATYSQIPTLRGGDTQTPYDGVGSTHLTLPAGWVADQNTAGMTRLLPSLHDVELRQERHRLGLDITKVLPGHWEFSAGFRNEDRDGLKSIGAVIGNSGGNPRAVLLPEPIDYRTREFDAVASYQGGKAQLEMRYYLSLFDNANSSLTWQNPYSAINGWDPSAGFPTGEGSLSLAPDNRFHQVSVTGGYNLSERTRVTADVALGQMTQNDPFLPYTVNPVLDASLLQPLPRTSLDGRIDTTVANLRVSSRPTPRLHLGASYRFDDRDNRTPRDEYVYIGGDSQTQDASTTSSHRRFNEPYSYRDRQLRLDASYRLGSQTRLSASAERRETERTFSERESATEDTFAFGVARNIGDRVEAALHLSRSNRDGSTYHGNEPFLSGYSPDYTATVNGQWENAPPLRKFFLADRQRDRAGLTMSMTPSEHWSLDLDASYLTEDYNASELGLTASRIGSYTADIAFTPNADFSMHGFYTRDELHFDQAGQSFSGGPSRDTQVIDPTRRWSARHGDQVDTVGFGLRWKPGPAGRSFGADYVHVRSDGSIDVAAGTGLTVAPLPPNTTRLDSLNIYDEWRLRKDISMRVGYWYERYRSADWALDGVTADQLANVILLGEPSPDYRVHVITLSLVVQF